MNRLKTVCLVVVTSLCLWESGFGQASTPIIVAKISRLGQTAPITPIVLLTPDKTTLYRVSVFADNSVPLNNDSY
jgi:hypothetical protein